MISQNRAASEKTAQRLVTAVTTGVLALYGERLGLHQRRSRSDRLQVAGAIRNCRGRLRCAGEQWPALSKYVGQPRTRELRGQHCRNHQRGVKLRADDACIEGYAG